MKINLKTITLVKGLESVTVNRNFTINHELGYTHYGIFLGTKFQGIINDMLGKQLPMTKRYCNHLWNIAQWAQLGALFRVSLPNLKYNYMNRLIDNVSYDINLTYNYMVIHYLKSDVYEIITIDSDTIYSLYAYNFEKQYENLDNKLYFIHENSSPNLWERFLSWLKNALN